MNPAVQTLMKGGRTNCQLPNLMLPDQHNTLLASDPKITYCTALCCTLLVKGRVLTQTELG